MNLDEACSQSAFGELIGTSQPAVSEMLSRGVLKPGCTARVWLLDYCAHMREQAAGRGADGELAFQRAKLAAVSRERAEIKLAVERREFASVELIEQVLASVGRSIVGTLEPLHVTLHKLVPELTPEAIKTIQVEVSKACAAAAAASLALLDYEESTAPQDQEETADEFGSQC